jgi:hypothetical protein
MANQGRLKYGDFNSMFYLGLTTSSAAAILLYYNRKIIKKLKESGATSPENARTLDEAGITGLIEVRHVARLRFTGKVKEIVDAKNEKRYYIP